MGKSRKKKSKPEPSPAPEPGPGAKRLVVINVFFARVPEEDLDIQFALEDLVDEASEVRSFRVNADGHFDTDGESWSYEVVIHDQAAVDQWAEQIAAKLPAILREFGEKQMPVVEVVAEAGDSQEVLRRIEVGKKRR
jgi:hypothetical protein